MADETITAVPFTGSGEGERTVSSLPFASFSVAPFMGAGSTPSAPAPAPAPAEQAPVTRPAPTPRPAQAQRPVQAPQPAPQQPAPARLNPTPQPIRAPRRAQPARPRQSSPYAPPTMPAGSPRPAPKAPKKSEGSGFGWIIWLVVALFMFGNGGGILSSIGDWITELIAQFQ